MMIPLELEVVWNGSVRAVVPFDQAREELAPRPYAPLPETIRLICKTCGGSFQELASRARHRVYCSVECRSRRLVRYCLVCDEPFEVPTKRKDQRHCSRRCGDITNARKSRARSMAEIGRLGGLKSGEARRRGKADE